MKNILHHIRKQPEEMRRGLLHLFTIAAGVILVSLWVYSLGANLTNPNTQAKTKAGLQPFSTLKGNIIDGYNSLSTPDQTQNNNL